jgi:hypothetical protein
MLVVSAATATGGTSVLRRVFDGHFEALRSDLLSCAWGAAIWLPLCLLPQSEHTLWCILAPLPATVIIATFSRLQTPLRRSLEEAGRSGYESLLSPQLFATVNTLPKRSIGSVSILCAVLLEATLAAAAAEAYPIAESLLLIATACIVWHTTRESRGNPHFESLKAYRQRAGVLACFLLTCLSMTPFLQAGHSTLPLGSMPLAPRALTRMPTGQVYTGVVLLAPALPKRTVLEPPSKSMFNGLSTLIKPLVVPFDGSYWFYQQPYTAPGKDAPIQRGDPIKNHIQSTDFHPLLMEAHQRLGMRVSATCCSAVSVSLTNADNRLGVIGVEAVLREITPTGTSSRSLAFCQSVPARSTKYPFIGRRFKKVCDTRSAPRRRTSSSTRSRSFFTSTLTAISRAQKSKSRSSRWCHNQRSSSFLPRL